MTLLAENHITWEKKKKKKQPKKPTQSHLEDGQRKQEEFFRGQSKSAIPSTV